jgi:hypothetical protein
MDQQKNAARKRNDAAGKVESGNVERHHRGSKEGHESTSALTAA